MKQKQETKRKISHDQFHSLVKKAAQPVNKPTVSDAVQSQTSAEYRSDGCNETRTHSDKIGDI